MQRGTLETMRDSEQDEDDETAPKRLGDVVAHLGFNLHASVTIAAQDDQGRERLCRYGARPPSRSPGCASSRTATFPTSYRPSRVCLGRLIERAIGADSLDTEPNSLGSSDLRSHVGSVRCAQFEYPAANGEVQPTADDEPRSQGM